MIADGEGGVPAPNPPPNQQQHQQQQQQIQDQQCSVTQILYRKE